MTLTSESIGQSELVETALQFWFADRQHIRSPFPDYIRPQLEKQATERFEQWLEALTDDAKDEINETIIAEKFEEILFEAALAMVLTEDEKITINYPFLPRINDAMEADANDPAAEKSVIVDRTLQKEKDQVFLRVVLEKQASKERWNTRFELPA